MSLYPEDKKAAFIGLFGGAILVLAMILGILNWTNMKYASHEQAAETTR